MRLTVETNDEGRNLTISPNAEAKAPGIGNSALAQIGRSASSHSSKLRRPYAGGNRPVLPQMIMRVGAIGLAKASTPAYTHSHQEGRARYRRSSVLIELRSTETHHQFVKHLRMRAE